MSHKDAKSVKLSYYEAQMLFLHRLVPKKISFMNISQAKYFSFPKDKLTWYKPKDVGSYIAVTGIPGWYAHPNAFVNRDQLIALMEVKG